MLKTEVKRSLLILLAFILCMTMFAGCGNGGDKEEPAEAQTGAAADQVQAEKGNEDAAKAAETGQTEQEAEKKTAEAAGTSADAAKGAAGKEQSGQAKQGQNGGTKKTEGPVVLTIRGNGVEKTTTWTMADLKNLSGQKTVAYSIVNNWPTKKFFGGKGVDINSVLKAAGMKGNAASFKVIAGDGYYVNLTKGQLTGANHYYPNVKSGSAAGAQSVPAILAWVVNEDGTSVSGTAEDSKLRLMVGQRGVNDVNTDVCVKNVSVIEVSTSDNGSWAAPVPSQGSGTVAAGTGITFSYDNIDKVKIHYTTDGSNPTSNSKVYNPSTTYYQPELTKPIVINGNTTLKVMVSGWGKKDSAVQTYTYTVE